MKKILILSCVALLMLSCTPTESVIDLSGEWKVKIDSVQYKIMLPGSLAENKVGFQPKDSVTNILTETYSYQGAAWYEKDIEIPTSWENHPVELFMERTKVSEVFINGIFLGSQNSVSTPHIYMIDSLLKIGKNSIRIKIDNTKSLLPLGGSHAYSEHTQSNWNGILGDFYLRKLPDICIRQIRIDSPSNGNCLVTVSLANYSKETDIGIKIVVVNSDDSKVVEETVKASVPQGKSEHTIKVRIPVPQLWDEYTPCLYNFRIEIPNYDSQCVQTGFRDFKTAGTQFINNGRVVFLRGKNEGGVFPLTGYPSMEINDWKRYFETIRSYGINHVRFHSWTPPQAAFYAADETGIFLQPELPLWGTYREKDTILISYMKQEGKRIIQTYGNHPSFVMFSLGNELEGDTAIMASIVKDLKKYDKRHLYILGTNNHYWDPQTHTEEDFFVAMRHGKAANNNSTDLRGSFSFADSNQGGIINCNVPNAMRNFTTAIQGMDKPVIGHETGQYQVYPNFEEIDKYTGVLRPLNFIVFKNRLKETGMSTKAKAFLKASGALAALCYREEIEMSLRTPQFGGFQLLDLQDYPGQGTALVGILDAFLESKNVISTEKWNEFCNDIVPLARFSKYCWNTDETFITEVQIANYGQSDIKDKIISCTLSTEDGETLYSEDIRNTAIPQGQLSTFKSLHIPLNHVKESQKLTFRIALKNTSYHNSWNIWVYPRYDKIKEGVIDGVTVTRDSKVFAKLYQEEKPVLYIPKEKDIKDQSVGGLFISDFWNYKVFDNVTKSLGKESSPGTLGLLIESPEHSIFNSFPTDFHSNWQWWNIIKKSSPIILDEMPKDYYPIVQVIDNFERNHKLGLIYQLPGTKALVCSSDLFAIADEPEVKALFHSLLNYLKTEKKQK